MRHDSGECSFVIVGTDDGLSAIIEYRDADVDRPTINLCKSGAMAIDGRGLFALLDRVSVARREELPCALVEAPAPANRTAQIADTKTAAIGAMNDLLGIALPSPKMTASERNRRVVWRAKRRPVGA